MLSEPQTLLSPPTSVCQQWLTENPGEPLHRGCFSSYGLHFTNAQSTPEASGNAHPWKQHSAQDGQEFEGSVPSLPHPLGVITPRSIRHHLPEFHSDEMPVTHRGHLHGNKPFSASSQSHASLSHYSQGVAFNHVPNVQLTLEFTIALLLGGYRAEMVLPP